MDDQERPMKAEIARSLSEFWEVRTPREKTLLMWGGLALGLALVYLLLWAPAYEGGGRLR
jgi:general secretion pathway protein M